MDKKGRRRFSSEFKAKIAIEALQERNSIETMSKKYEIHPNQIKQWKKDFLENGYKVFERGENSTEIDQKERLISELYRQIGELKVDCDFLKKKLY